MGQGLGQTRRVVPIWAVGTFVIGVLLSFQPLANAQSSSSQPKITFPSSLPDIVFVQTPQLAPGPLAQRFPRGSAIVRLAPSTRTQRPLCLTDGFFAAADPQISFSGTKILFSGQKTAADRWQIWEMDLNGEHQRQITQCAQNCLRAAYLPADEIVLSVEDPANSASYLAVVRADGSQFHRITFGNAPFELQTVLRDGRVVASAPWPLTASASPATSRLLYTLRPDGTALESFRCDHQQKGAQSQAAELADGSLTFVRAPTANATAGGQLMNIAQGAPTEAPLARSAGTLAWPQPISENKLLVAKQATAKSARFDLYLLDLRTGSTTERVYADPQLSSIQPVLVAPHPVPKHYWDTLDADSASGNLISLNSYMSAEAPHGRISTPISHVRVFTLDANTGGERNLGEAPVETDGSFFVQVPANVPVRFVLLDAKGQIIREEHSWIWVRPGEQRGCTGCHGDKAVAPDNHWPLTLRRFDTPTALGESSHGSGIPAK